ncbi:Crp/Fnr family transcriptional regulator [Roseobacter sinensis]|uniref:Crp/Fnr family transcriptional regulator n=1 Tax=Roseobacter sinensis TaxID=2931391 RepID=A0ABT3BGT5_9RHOB|nr:Crp/Fnr family transcriptional regulator [Roseobacter sp. WL0113]MCV3272786.1 Crp/Fnr family transcriptional regulator [Roseobacter sp. WL0113]
MSGGTSLVDYRDEGDLITAPDGACLFQPGDESAAYLIVLSGAVRVEQTNAAGRTVVLYRVLAGDSCVLTTTGLLSGRPYSGYGYAEGPLQALAIPAPRFQALLARDARFRELVFHSLALRVGELTDVIDELLLHRTDLRLARWLARQPETVLHLTHEDIAQELGTAREVVSRTLKSFERNGWIELGRGKIALMDSAALKTYADRDSL